MALDLGGAELVVEDRRRLAQALVQFWKVFPVSKAGATWGRTFLSCGAVRCDVGVMFSFRSGFCFVRGLEVKPDSAYSLLDTYSLNNSMVRSLKKP